MLTATYTLVALSVEQTNVRTSLQSLQKTLHSTLRQQADLSPTQVEIACDTIRRLYESCHWRKLDKFLIPALRRASSAADKLLEDLDALSQAAADSMAAALQAVENATVDSEARVRQFCAALERFCGALLERLEREERELFPMAGTVISGEDWFAIANQMLAHDAYQEESRGGERPRRVGRGFMPRPDRTQRQGFPLSYAH
ncbi:MAG: hemerythrin domain-containing protein [Telluria sp.]